MEGGEGHGGLHLGVHFQKKNRLWGWGSLFRTQEFNYVQLRKKIDIHTHTIKITNYLQQTLPHSYMPYIVLGTVLKKL